MTVVFKSPRAAPTLPSAEPRPSRVEHANGLIPVLLCGVALLTIGGPPFVRMPLTNDAVLFDLQARLASEGSVLYRDMLEPNLPGVVWIHLAVRAALGDSSESLRLFDLFIAGAVISLGAVWVRRAGGSLRASAWFAFAALLFYLSISEWCHCQRDAWMLLPSLAALTIRGRQTARWLDPSNPLASRPALGWAALEGILWGSGVWIKPYVALPGFVAWAVTQLLVRRRRCLILDTTGLLTGGLLMGACGVSWLVQAGSWEAFWFTLTEWNPRYFAAGREHWTLARCIPMAIRLWPWTLLHVIAAPLAVHSLWQVSRRDAAERALPHGGVLHPLLAAFYLAWTAQAFGLQHLFDYVHAPALMIALLLVASRMATAMAGANRPGQQLAAAAFLLLAVVSSPLLKSECLQVWSRCIKGPNSPRLQDRLAHFDNPNREDLARVAEFLRRNGAAGPDVCCYNSDLVSLYQVLHLQPPMRFVYLHELLVFFPDRNDEIAAALEQSGQRFVVTDLVSCGMPRAQAEEIGPDGPLAPPPTYPRNRSNSYPWSHPVVFRSGTYLVHRIDGPPGDVAVRPKQ